jgi:hypothetical protein
MDHDEEDRQAEQSYRGAVYQKISDLEEKIRNLILRSKDQEKRIKQLERTLLKTRFGKATHEKK